MAMDIDNEFAEDTPQSSGMSPGRKSAALGSGMSDKEFDALVAEAFELIPENFRAKVKNVALLIENEPSVELRASEKLKPNETLLALYHGVPATERGIGYGVGMTLPDTITVYRKPILDAAGQESGVDFGWGPPNEPMKRRIRDIIRDTIWHEIAHYFGMDEFAVDAREAEGTNEFKT